MLGADEDTIIFCFLCLNVKLCNTFYRFGEKANYLLQNWYFQELSKTLGLKFNLKALQKFEIMIE